jgi:hypothetical protein
MRRLDVILRTCVATSVQPWKRIVDVPRDVLVFKSLKSLVNSINEYDNAELDIKLTILDDHSPEEGLNKIKEICDTCNRPYEVISLEGKGHTGADGSSMAQFKFARDCNDLVYMVEDDYFHAKDAIRRMVEAFFYFRQRSDLIDVVIYPYDSTHLYNMYDDYKGADPTRVYILDNHYWRTTEKTAYTMFTHSNILKFYWPLFENLGTNFPSVAEDQTINRMYNNGVTMGGPVTVFSPMPSLAVHVSYHMPAIIKTDFIDWVTEFHNLEV